MADRNDWERDRERAAGRWDLDRGREWHEHGDGSDYREDYGRGAERYRDHSERNEPGRTGSYGRPEWRGRSEMPRFGDGPGWGLYSSGGGTWGRYAGYAGKGPKNYVRSDERIWEDVNERLTEHPQIDASDMEVQVKQGEVTLTGLVEDRRSKRLAEDLAESVAGVKEVYNQLKIHHPADRGATALTRRS